MEKLIKELEQEIAELYSVLVLTYDKMQNTNLYQKLERERLDKQYQLSLLKKEFENE